MLLVLLHFEVYMYQDKPVTKTMIPDKPPICFTLVVC